MKNLIKYTKHLGLLILPLLLVFMPFGVWLFNEYHDYNKENLILWTSFIPVLSYTIGVLIGVLHSKINKKDTYNDSNNDSYH